MGREARLPRKPKPATPDLGGEPAAKDSIMTPFFRYGRQRPVTLDDFRAAVSAIAKAEL